MSYPPQPPSQSPYPGQPYPGQPYQGQPGYPYPQYQNPLPTLLGPAKRVGILMFITGILAMLFGGMMLLVIAALGMPEIRNSPQFAEMLREAKGESTLRLAFGIVMGLSFLYGVTVFVLAFFVRRGGLGPIIVSLIGTILVAIPFALSALVALSRADILSLIMPLLFVAVLGLQIAGLIHAMTKASAVQQWRMYLASGAGGYYAGAGYPQQPYAQPYAMPYGQAPGPHPYAQPPAPPAGPPPAEAPPRNE